MSEWLGESLAVCHGQYTKKKPKEFSNTRSALLNSIKSAEICCAEGKFSNILCPKYHAGEKGFCPEIK